MRYRNRMRRRCEWTQALSLRSTTALHGQGEVLIVQSDALARRKGRRENLGSGPRKSLGSMRLYAVRSLRLKRSTCVPSSPKLCSNLTKHLQARRPHSVCRIHHRTIPRYPSFQSFKMVKLPLCAGHCEQACKFRAAHCDKLP